jgi:glycosyltransferase involved in cell wall biosynthesis
MARTATPALFTTVKILHVTSSLDPRGGGVAEAIRQFAAALVRAGHETEIATVDAPGADWLRETAIPVHALGPHRGSYQYAPGLEPWLRAHRDDYDAVLSHGLWQYHGLATWRAWRGARGPRFVYAHGMLDPWFKRTYPRKHLKKWFYWIFAEYWILRQARAVFFTCEEEKRLARESFWLYHANEAVAPLGIEEPPGPAERQLATFYDAFPQLRGRRFLLFLGRVHPKKGVDLLLQAINAQAPPPDALSLVVAGPGNRDFIESLRGDAGGGEAFASSWPGMLTGDIKWGALRAADAFILPSHQENFGLAVVEALACGTPVLISNKVNIWREIAEDGAGLVADDTLSGVGQLLTQWRAVTPEQRADFAARARRCFETRFQIDLATAGLVQQLRTLGVS